MHATLTRLFAHLPVIFRSRDPPLAVLYVQEYRRLYTVLVRILEPLVGAGVNIDGGFDTA